MFKKIALILLKSGLATCGIAGACCLSYLGLDYIEKSERIKKLEAEMEHVKAFNKISADNHIHVNEYIMKTIDEDRYMQKKFEQDNEEKHCGRYPWKSDEDEKVTAEKAE